MELQEKHEKICMEVRLDKSNDEHYIWLGNSDWRVEGTMASESGPDMGNTNSYTNWQSGEPNDVGNDPGEDYADMEINRSGRTDGGWNDLRRRPNCSGRIRCHFRLCC